MPVELPAPSAASRRGSKCSWLRPVALLGSVLAVGLPPRAAAGAPPAAERGDSPAAAPATRPSVAELTEQLKTKDRRARNAAADRLAEWGPAAEPALPVLMVRMWDDCCYSPHLGPVLKAIGPGAVKFLLARLTGPDGPAAANAAEALGMMGADAGPAVPAMAEILKGDPRPGGVQFNIVFALERIGPDAGEAAPALLARVAGGRKDKDNSSCWYSGRALAHFGQGGAAVVPDLRRLLDDESPDVRGAAALALVGMGREVEAAEPVLLQVMKTAPQETRYSGINGLAFGGQAVAKRHIPVFLGALRDPYQPIRAEATQGLAEAGLAVLPVMYKSLDDPNPEARHAAIWVLAELARRTPVLMPAIIDPIAQKLRDPSSDVRGQAAFSLGLLGPAAADAVPALRAVPKDGPDQSIRRDAAEALDRIEHPDPPMD